MNKIKGKGRGGKCPFCGSWSVKRNVNGFNNNSLICNKCGTKYYWSVNQQQHIVEQFGINYFGNY